MPLAVLLMLLYAAATPRRCQPYACVRLLIIAFAVIFRHTLPCAILLIFFHAADYCRHAAIYVVI